MSIANAAVLSPNTGRRFRAYTTKHLDDLVSRGDVPANERLAMRAVASVLPFRVNSYVVNELIDWQRVPDDPIYRLVFAQPDMLPAADMARIADLLTSDAPATWLTQLTPAFGAECFPHEGARPPSACGVADIQSSDRWIHYREWER